ncbi:MAG: ABC transporter ATP-binding protein [Pseudomonadota bacterium]
MLEVDHLTAHAGRTSIIHGISFGLNAGETVAVLGASGSGKSLTGRAIIALPPRGVRYGGAVRLHGDDILLMPERERNGLRGQSLAMIFQEPATALNPVMRIGEQIAEPLAIHTDMTRAERNRRVEALLERTGLAAAGVRPERYPHELSGGQRQRVAVALAIALEPALVVADEPTSALDSVSAAQVLDLLMALTAGTGTALMIITHDIAVAARAGRVLVMDDGRIAETGATRQVLHAPQSRPGRALVEGSAITLPQRSAVAGARVLCAQRLTVTRGRAKVVVDADLSVRSGERLAIVGSSGSGKTSLSRALIGLLPSTGEVKLDGVPVATDAPALRQAVQMVFQDPATSFNPRHTIAQIVTEPLFGRAVSFAQKRVLAEETLSRVGLPGVLERKPHAFSGGQRQRIAIARALISGPRVLIADEAVSALDAALRAEVIRLLDDLTASEGIALVFIAHDLGLVRALADRIVVMAEGRIVEDAPAEQVFAEPQAPATRALLAAASHHSIV